MINILLGADQGIKTNTEWLISTNQHISTDTREAWQHLCPLNLAKSSNWEFRKRRIKQSRLIFTNQDSWSWLQTLLLANYVMKRDTKTISLERLVQQTISAEGLVEERNLDENKLILSRAIIWSRIKDLTSHSGIPSTIHDVTHRTTSSGWPKLL